jgi:hypothetical protein
MSGVTKAHAGQRPRPVAMSRETGNRPGRAGPRPRQARRQVGVDLRLLHKLRQRPAAAGQKAQARDQVERPVRILQGPVEQKRRETRHDRPGLRAARHHAPGLELGEHARCLRVGRQGARGHHFQHARCEKPEDRPVGARGDRSPVRPVSASTTRANQPRTSSAVQSRALREASMRACARSAHSAQPHPGTWRGAGASKAR